MRAWDTPLTLVYCCLAGDSSNFPRLYCGESVQKTGVLPFQNAASTAKRANDDKAVPSPSGEHKASDSHLGRENRVSIKFH